MSHVFRHPNYYKELKRQASEQANKRAGEQAAQETVPYNDIEEANKPASPQAEPESRSNHREQADEPSS